jgi:tetratricopeptide (TPR) repeat protein
MRYVFADTAQVSTDPTVWLAQGQCVEQYGTGEAYLPILEALGQLCQPSPGERLVALLRQQAPTWLGQMPWLPTPEDRDRLHDELHGTTRARMLRELATVLDTLTADTPLVLVLEHLGYPDQALQRSREALALAEELGHPFSLAFTLRQTVGLHQLRREAYEVLTRTQRLLTLATEHGFAQMVASGTHDRGWALAMQGHVAEGIALIRQGYAAFRATGGERGALLALLAEALGKAGEAEEGLRMLAEGLALVEQHGERVHEAELYRLKGELLLALFRDNDTAAHACFQQALHVARRQQAKSLELRAAMSLGRLWQQQGKRDAARQLLAEVYGWFTEGFETADLQDARALLAALA